MPDRKIPKSDQQQKTSFMSIQPEEKSSPYLVRARQLLPIMATAAMAAGTDAALSSKAYSAPVEVPYNGKVYTLETSTCFAQGTITSGCNSATDFRKSSWFGNAQLAKDLSEATKGLLGLPNPALGTPLGPNFVWQSGDPSTFNESFLPFDGWEWDPILNRADPAASLCVV